MNRSKCCGAEVQEVGNLNVCSRCHSVALGYKRGPLQDVPTPPTEGMAWLDEIFKTYDIRVWQRGATEEMAKHAIATKLREVMLEVIGEDSDDPYGSLGSANHIEGKIRSKLRKKQRQRLDSLFGLEPKEASDNAEG